MLQPIQPANIRLFHITALHNMPAIVAAGCLLVKTQLTAQGGGYTNIAHATIQARRATKAVRLGAGGLLHDYVPFYFAPRSPMLRSIEGGNVAGFTGGQASVVTLETTVVRAIAN
jgi:ssDNA thymidine ADP-ribosyltransferase, DarT